jgi:hypothetical protein
LGLNKFLAPAPVTSRDFFSQRLTSGLVFLTGLLVLQFGLHFAQYKRIAATQPHMFGAPQETRWVNLLVPIAFIIFGCVIIARPQIVRDMVEKNFPDHKLTQETQESTVIAGRIIGSLFIVSEIYNILIQLKLVH